MKKLFLIFGVVLVLSCSKDYKKMIVGTWEYLEKDDGMLKSETKTFTIEGKYNEEFLTRTKHINTDIVFFGDYWLNEDTIKAEGACALNGIPIGDGKPKMKIMEISDSELKLLNILDGKIQTYKRVK